MRRTIIAVSALVILTVVVVFVVIRINNSRLSHSSDWAIVAEVKPQRIALEGATTAAAVEFSGLAWFGDTLVLIPQYPNRFGNSLYTISKEEILSVIDGQTTDPITPLEIGLASDGIYQIDGFEGLESIAFAGDQLFMTIESSPDDMLGHLVAGSITADGQQILLNGDFLAELPPQTDATNYSDEALTVLNDGRLLTLYEANGANLNERPVAHLFTPNLIPQISLPLPHLEYRITDATAVDENDRFWVINYTPSQSIYKLDPAEDPLFARYGIGVTHAENNVVERLVELEYTGSEIILSETPPIQLELLGDDEGRNWEGIVRLDDRGFLLVTDKFPETILAFVPFE